MERGMKSKNENLTASSLFIPNNLARDIVVPLLETPGNKAKDWNIPIPNEFFQDNLASLKENFVENKSNEVNINAIPSIR